MLSTISYSDSTPGVTYAYDRLGRQSSIVMNGTTTTFAYNLAGQVLSESYSGGTLAGLSVTNGYDGYMRRTTLAALNSGSPVVLENFGYDNASRLQTATDNTTATPYSGTYAYLANSPLVQQITFKQNATVRMTTSKQYDFLNRLTQISSAPSAAAPVSFNYEYNSANQRTRRIEGDGSYWRYQYDALGQVTLGKKYWSDQTPAAGQQFGYSFDDIGNRTQTLAGGDQTGANERMANYYANTLNQYTNRTVPGYVDVMGLAYATNPVTVNGTTAYRHGEYLRQELSVVNSSTSVWETVTVAAAGQTTITGGKFVPKTPELFTYDLDGNLTSDGHWNYTWDGENRLISLAVNTTNGPQQSLKFEYDSRSRRVRKEVWGNTNWSGTATNDLKFVYDGWNLLAELNAANSPARTYLWGLDLSGSVQGAGGVGGLLEMVYYGASSTNCFAAFDGNGNLAGLANAIDGTVLAQYDYGPFGEVIRGTGPMAKANACRFSTKYQDDETDLLYYGNRYLAPYTGHWLSRDPKGEDGGPNLYEFAENAPLHCYDSLGCLSFRFETVVGESHVIGGLGPWAQPWWAGTGTASISGNAATTSVTVNNAPWHGIARPDYCNTVDYRGTIDHAGGIKLFLRDHCGGDFLVSFNFSVALSGSGPYKTKAQAWLRSGRVDLWKGFAGVWNGNFFSVNLPFLLYVHLVNDQEKEVVTYIPYVNFPQGSPVTSGTANAQLTYRGAQNL